MKFKINKNLTKNLIFLIIYKILRDTMNRLSYPPHLQKSPELIRY